jgi:hypothetical protein
MSATCHPRPTPGFQEALVRQVNDLAELLGSEWAWVCSMSSVQCLSQADECLVYVQVGVGRDDGVAAGEFSPIFYKT